MARPHLHGAVAQLDGLVDALHDLVEACGRKRNSQELLPLPGLPLTALGSKASLGPLRPGQRAFSVKGQIVNILGFAGQEAKLRLLCRCMP